jgi:hypothetical protein
VVLLPRLEDLNDGGPIVTVINGAAAASGKTLTLKTGDAAETTVVTSIAEKGHAILHKDGVNNAWRATL